MNDVQIYELRYMVDKIEGLLTVLRSRITCLYSDRPTLPLEITRLCGVIASILTDLATKAMGNVDVNACAEYLAMGNTGSDSSKRSANLSGAPQSMGCQSSTDQQGPNNPPPG